MGKKTFFGIVLIFIVTLTTSAFAQSFSTSDFAGNWYAYVTEVDPSEPGVYWLRGNIDVDESGNLNAGTYYAPNGTSVTLSGGQLVLDQQGVISGSFTAEGQPPTTIVHGKMDSSKTHGVSVLVDSSGTMDILNFIKGGGTFSPQDLEGDWYVYTTIIDAIEEAVFWAYGTFSVNQGNMTGSFTAADGRDTAITSGTLTLDSEGIIGGQFALDIPQTISIAHGKLDQSKTKGAFVSVEPTGTMAIGYLVKAGGTFKQSDAAGKWYVYGLNIDPSIPAVFWAYGESNTDASGNLNASLSVPVPSVPPTFETITATGAFIMNSFGEGTGTFDFSTGDSAVAPSAKLDQSKTSYVGVTVSTKVTPPNIPPMGIWQFIKAPYVALPGMPLLLLGD
jgi:hypothetical protein